VILRLSQNVSAKIKAGKLSELPLDENPYADGSCNLFTTDRTQYIIVSNTKSLLSAVMYGRGITDVSHFVKRVLITIQEFTDEDGLPSVYQQFIAPTSGTVAFAKALNRSVTGSMNDLIKFAKHWLVEEEISLYDLRIRLNDTLLSALATDRSPRYGRPSEAFRMLQHGRVGQ
jgi:hypothetical protein